MHRIETVRLYSYAKNRCSFLCIEALYMLITNELLLVNTSCSVKRSIQRNWYKMSSRNVHLFSCWSCYSCFRSFVNLISCCTKNTSIICQESSRCVSHLVMSSHNSYELVNIVDESSILVVNSDSTLQQITTTCVK